MVLVGGAFKGFTRSLFPPVSAVFFGGLGVERECDGGRTVRPLVAGGGTPDVLGSAVFWGKAVSPLEVLGGGAAGIFDVSPLALRGGAAKIPFEVLGGGSAAAASPPLVGGPAADGGPSGGGVGPVSPLACGGGETVRVACGGGETVRGTPYPCGGCPFILYCDMSPCRCGGGEGVVRGGVSSSSGGGGAAYAGAGWWYTTSS